MGDGPRLQIRRRPLTGDPRALPAALHPVLRRVYAARGVIDGAQLVTGLDRLEPHGRLSNIDAAATLLADALVRQERILVVGDFDADGATSTALAVLGLRALGAGDVDFLVPNRFEHGYGLTPEIVELAQARAPDLIVTVDNGISSIEGVAAAREAGIRVLITDHHLPGAVLPLADVIVNPNLPGDGFSSKHLAGVGVMFYVLAALRAELRRRGRLDETDGGPRLADFLDLVALGTVADVVALDYNNRILVANGLARIRAGRTRAGIKALLEVAGRNLYRTQASDLGFAVGPRLNAAGRLDDMSLGIACLLAQDESEARRLAATLDALNRERREIESEMKDEAMAMVDAIVEPDSSELPFGLCVFDPGWHPGVIGIVASRLKERYHRPVIVFAADGEAHLRGSARSVAGVHIRDTLDAVASHHPKLLRKFGGHAMAAGLTIAAADFALFCEAFDAEVRRLVDATQLQGVVWSDGELDGDSLGMDLAQALREAGPWGQAFPEPVFDGVFVVEDRRVVGDTHLKMRARPTAGGPPIDAIAFNQAQMIAAPPVLQLVYRLDVNEFRGLASPQLMVDHVVAPS